MTCLPSLTQGSRIVNLASAAAFCPQPYFAVYAATKSYVLSFSQALGAELIKNGIYVTAVCPGRADTEFFDVSGRLPHKWKDAVMARPGKGGASGADRFQEEKAGICLWNGDESSGSGSKASAAQYDYKNREHGKRLRRTTI